MRWKRLEISIEAHLITRTMAVYPAQLTTEEKNLRKRYTRLQEKRKLLKKRSDKSIKTDDEPGPSGVPTKTPPKEVLNPKDAKEAAKKLLMAGKLTIHKQATRKTGFKRVGELPGQAPPAKKPNSVSSKDADEGGDGRKGFVKPKYAAPDVKALYTRFIKSSSKPDDIDRIPRKAAEATENSSAQRETESKTYTTKDCTVYVRWETDRKKSPAGITEEALRIAFVRFGSIQTVLLRSPEESGLKTKESAFLTFNAPNIAKTARNEMDGGMIRGVDVWVSFASNENGYVELTEEAANNPWAMIAADRDSARNKQDTKKSKRPMKIYETTDF